METLKNDFTRYVKETLDIPVKPEAWEGEGSLPFFLSNLYTFFQVSFLDTPCLVMVLREEEEQTPASVRKHIGQVQKHWRHQVVFACRRISAANRNRLIGQKVPFVVPGNQMYLPPLGIDLREHFKTIRNIRPAWSPSTQAVFLYALIYGHEKGLTPKEMADRFGYTPMSMTRAFDELETLELCHVAMEGRRRILRLDGDRRTLWEKALAFLRSPVRKLLWVKFPANGHPGVKAGLTALAGYSSLAGPPNPVFAMGGKEWKGVRNLNSVLELPVGEPDASQLEIWSYSPALLAQDGLADRFSLYLSLWKTNDERVESALDAMMEKARW
jgi:hypothetical protein